MGEEKVVYRVLVGKPEGKSPLGRPKRRWVDNIRKNITITATNEYALFRAIQQI